MLPINSPKYIILYLFNKHYNCTVEIKYNDEDFKRIIRPDLNQIEPKSSHIVMLIIRNIDEKFMPEYFNVLVRDVVSNDHRLKRFTKAPEATKLIFKVLYE